MYQTGSARTHMYNFTPTILGSKVRGVCAVCIHEPLLSSARPSLSGSWVLSVTGDKPEAVDTNRGQVDSASLQWLPIQAHIQTLSTHSHQCEKCAHPSSSPPSAPASTNTYFAHGRGRWGPESPSSTDWPAVPSCPAGAGDGCVRWSSRSSTWARWGRGSCGSGQCPLSCLGPPGSRWTQDPVGAQELE